MMKKFNQAKKTFLFAEQALQRDAIIYGPYEKLVYLNLFGKLHLKQEGYYFLSLKEKKKEWNCVTEIILIK